jgi:hypothetical protein
MRQLIGLRMTRLLTFRSSIHGIPRSGQRSSYTGVARTHEAGSPKRTRKSISASMLESITYWLQLKDQVRCRAAAAQETETLLNLAFPNAAVVLHVDRAFE